MTDITYKDRDSSLRILLKRVKHQYDDLATLRQYEPAIRRLVFLNANPEDKLWCGEALHQLALYERAQGNLGNAIKYCELSLDQFADHECLGPARTRRTYGLLLAEKGDTEAGLQQIKLAIALHDKDVRSASSRRQRSKGERQRRITESYEWRIRLIANSDDTQALNSLVKFALTGCQDCYLRDQQEAIEFAFPRANGVQRPLLDARMIEINARRYKLSSTMRSMAKLAIDTQLFIARRLARNLIRKD